MAFSFEAFKNTKLSGGKKLTIENDDVEDFLEFKKGPFCFLLLSVLYPDLKLDQISFHQDHMHPHSRFNTKIIDELGLEQDTINRWQSMRDQLPNLQLLEGTENSTKQATPLITWVEKNDTDESYFRQRNYVPVEQSLRIEDFEKFFDARRLMLKNKLREEFNLVSQHETLELVEEPSA
jgi:hypothetical protein